MMIGTRGKHRPAEAGQDEVTAEDEAQVGPGADLAAHAAQMRQEAAEGQERARPAA